jgi:hypothetical protein
MAANTAATAASRGVSGGGATGMLVSATTAGAASACAVNSATGHGTEPTAAIGAAASDAITDLGASLSAAACISVSAASDGART